MFLFNHSTYTRVFNFGQNIESKMTIRLIRGSTYTRVYTVYYYYYHYYPFFPCLDQYCLQLFYLRRGSKKIKKNYSRPFHDVEHQTKRLFRYFMLRHRQIPEKGMYFMSGRKISVSYESQIS